MADGTSAERTPALFGDIVVIGGGCYGAYYVRQLSRAAQAGAVQWQRLLVVDRDPNCLVARSLGAPISHSMPAPRVVTRDWGAFLDSWIPLTEWSGTDAIVPSPLMPHLFVEYLERRIGAYWPDRAIHRSAPGTAVGTPWERRGEDGTSYVSHATWMCPVNCIEPRICPHTRDVRDWTMPDSIAVWAELRRAEGESLAGPFTFHCTHRAYGVGMVDKASISDAEEKLVSAAGKGAVRAVVATASHCHGAVSLLEIGPS